MSGSAPLGDAGPGWPAGRNVLSPGNGGGVFCPRTVPATAGRPPGWFLRGGWPERSPFAGGPPGGPTPGGATFAKGVGGPSIFVGVGGTGWPFRCCACGGAPWAGATFVVGGGFPGGGAARQGGPLGRGRFPLWGGSTLSGSVTPLEGAAAGLGSTNGTAGTPPSGGGPVFFVPAAAGGGGRTGRPPASGAAPCWVPICGFTPGWDGIARPAGWNELVPAGGPAGPPAAGRPGRPNDPPQRGAGSDPGGNGAPGGTPTVCGAPPSGATFPFTGPSTRSGSPGVEPTAPDAAAGDGGVCTFEAGAISGLAGDGGSPFVGGFGWSGFNFDRTTIFAGGGGAGADAGSPTVFTPGVVGGLASGTPFGGGAGGSVGSAGAEGWRCPGSAGAPTNARPGGSASAGGPPGAAATWRGPPGGVGAAGFVAVCIGPTDRPGRPAGADAPAGSIRWTTLSGTVCAAFDGDLAGAAAPAGEALFAGFPGFAAAPTSFANGAGRFLGSPPPVNC